MSKINCNPDLYWELYAKVLPLEEAVAIKLFNSAWIKSLSDEEINELLKLSRLKALAILELYTFADSFPFVKAEDKALLTNAIKYAKEDEIATDAKDCFAVTRGYYGIKHEFALITASAKNSFESSCCLKIASIPPATLCDHQAQGKLMLLIVSSSSLKEARKIYTEAMLLLAINDKLFFKYINSFYPEKTDESSVYWSNTADSGVVSYLQEATETTHPQTTVKSYIRKPGHRHKIKAKDLE